jgi:mannose/fructose-specific phosphotransferase system component IIA
MSELARGIVVAHGSLANALVQEVERISGQAGVLTAVSNEGCGREEIERRVAEAAAGGPAVVFVDMPCGSCFFAAMRAARERSDVRVVTGVNLPMLLDFVHNRALPPEDGAARAAGKGTDAIRQA